MSHSTHTAKLIYFGSYSYTYTCVTFYLYYSTESSAVRFRSRFLPRHILPIRPRYIISRHILPIRLRYIISRYILPIRPRYLISRHILPILLHRIVCRSISVSIYPTSHSTYTPKVYYLALHSTYMY